MSVITRKVKPYYESVIEPIVRIAQERNINPNLITVGGFVLTCIGSLFLYFELFFLSILLLVAGALADSIDGAIARKTGKVSKFGAFLDSTFDRFSDALPFTALGVRYASAGDEVGTFLSFTALISSFGVSYTRARAESLGVVGLGGVFERTERWIVLISSLLLGIPKAGLFLITAGSIFTVFQRIVHTKKALEGKDEHF